MNLVYRSMFFRFRFSKLLRQSRYAEAIALWHKAGGGDTGDILWAYYQLGMYSSVLRAHWDQHHIKGGVALAASLAACGEREVAYKVVSRLQALTGYSNLRPDLIRVLASFVPELALPLLQKVKEAPAPLLAALLLHDGRTQEATALLERSLTDAELLSSLESDMQLLACNLRDTPAEQLARLNAFLRINGLATLALRDASRPLGTLNIVADAPLPSRDGPLLTVLMTAYNSADRILVALDGLLKQTYRNIEVIVVDDASTDNTGELVLDLARQDSRVHYQRLSVNAGTFVAKNVGFGLAKGEFVTCHDSDDWSHPERLALQIKPLLDDASLVATTSNWVRLQDDGVFYARSVYPLIRLNPSSPLFRRDIVARDAGLWDVVRTGADSEFHARLKLVFGRDAVYRVKQLLAFGSHRENSLMTAADTGHSENEISPVRLAYWEAWNEWHIQALQHDRTPYMPKMDANFSRAFRAPCAIEVPQVALNDVLLGLRH